MNHHRQPVATQAGAAGAAGHAYAGRDARFFGAARRDRAGPAAVAWLRGAMLALMMSGQMHAAEDRYAEALQYSDREIAVRRSHGSPKPVELVAALQNRAACRWDGPRW